MSQIQNWFQEFYTKDVSVLLQSEGFLTKGMTTDTDEVVGSTVYWNRIGSGEATVHPTGISPVGLMSPSMDRVSATIQDWDADAEFKARDNNKLSGNQQIALTKTGGNAIGRKYDELLFDAIAAESNVVGTVGGGDTITLNAILTANAQIVGLQRNMNTTFCAVPAMLMSKFMLVESFSNSQYVGDNPIVKALGGRTWMGITFFLAEDKFFTDRAPVASNIDVPLWHKDCVGRVTQELTGARIDWLAREKAWHIGQTFSGCSKVIQVGGTKRIRGLMPTTV